MAKDDGAILKTPTHVLIRAERVRERPSVDARVKRDLPAGFDVRVIESEAGWAAIARDGERLGYMPAESLLRRQ